jgi:hypothetical protein
MVWYVVMCCGFVENGYLITGPNQGWWDTYGPAIILNITIFILPEFSGMQQEIAFQWPVRHSDGSLLNYLTFVIRDYGSVPVVNDDYENFHDYNHCSCAALVQHHYAKACLHFK